MLIKNEYGTFVILEDKVFCIESNTVFETGPISEEESKEFELTNCYVAFKKNDLLHRDNDLPALIFPSGSKEWYQNNLLHRDNDLPALIFPNGEMRWHQNDLLHRDNDLPAVIYADGTKRWYQNGTCIREEYANQ